MGPHPIILATHAPPGEVGAASCRRESVNQMKIGQPGVRRSVPSRVFPLLPSADGVDPPCVTLPPTVDTALELEGPSERG